MTEAELDRLCGGTPSLRSRCDYPGCGWTSRAYYSPGNARSAKLNHLRITHGLADQVQSDTPGRGTRARLYERY